MQLELPDGTILTLPDAATGADAAAAIGPGLARAALAVKLDGEVRDLARPLDASANGGAGAPAKVEIATELCRGPHAPSTKRIKAFKLQSVAGAYWRGDASNPMLTRVYGTAFFSKKDLDDYLERLERARANDHRRLGPQLGLFTFSEVAP